MTTFKIPVLSIQSTLMSIHDHPKVVDLKAWLIEKVEKERGNWGITGRGFKIDSDLKRWWYPIFIINNIWLASAFVEHLAEYKPWESKKRIVLKDKKDIFVRVRKHGKIHAGTIEGKSMVCVRCMPWDCGANLSNAFRLKDVEVIEDIIKHKAGEICKTCIRMGNIQTSL